MNSILLTLKTNRRLKNTLISLCVFGIIIVMLPFAIQWGAQYALKDQGASQASIEDINLNLFNGKFELINLKTVFKDQPVLQLKHLFVDLDMGALWGSKVVIESVLIEGLSAQVKRDKDGVLSVNGYQVPVANAGTQDKEAKVNESEPLAFAVQSALFVNSTLNYSEADFEQNVAIKEIKLSGLKSWEKLSITHIKAEITEQNTSINANIDATLFTDALTLKGDLDVSGLSTQPYHKFYQQQVKKLNALVDVNAQFNLILGKQIKGSVTHKLGLKQVLVDYAPYQYSLNKLSSKGQTTLDGNQISIDAEVNLSDSKLVDLASKNPLKILQKLALKTQTKLVLGESLKADVNYTLALEQLSAHYKQLDYSLKALNSNGKTNLEGSHVVVDAELELNDSQLVDAASSTLLNSINKVTLNKFHFDANSISFNNLRLYGIDILDNDKHKKLLNLETLSLQQFNFDTQQSSIRLNQVELQQPNIDVTLSKQKQITHLAIIDPILERFKTESTQQKVTKPNKPSKPMVINVGEVRLTKPGMLLFKDLSVAPNYSTKLHFNTIEIDNMSSETVADFKLGLKQGDYTTIDIKGKGLLFNPVDNLAYTVDIKQLDLPPVSSYTTKSMGYGMKSGVVDVLITGSIKQQKIDTKVDLKIDSIEVIETDKETAAQITGASGMSIDMALSTLKDKENIIDLELPIGGDIKKPDFDLSLIINKAMGIAMKAASIGYLKYALQPFSSLVTLFNLASDAVSSISLAPISFETNKARLVSEQKALLDKVSNILTERPGIKIKACSVTSLSDQNSVKKQLLEAKKQAYLKQYKGKKLTQKQQTAALSKIKVDDVDVQQAIKILADKRSAKVKTYLTSIKKVNSARILNCLSGENLKKASKSVVELVI